MLILLLRFLETNTELTMDDLFLKPVYTGETSDDVLYENINNVDVIDTISEKIDDSLVDEGLAEENGLEYSVGDNSTVLVTVQKSDNVNMPFVFTDKGLLRHENELNILENNLTGNVVFPTFRTIPFQLFIIDIFNFFLVPFIKTCIFYFNVTYRYKGDNTLLNSNSSLSKIFEDLPFESETGYESDDDLCSHCSDHSYVNSTDDEENDDSEESNDDEDDNITPDDLDGIDVLNVIRDDDRPTLPEISCK